LGSPVRLFPAGNFVVTIAAVGTIGVEMDTDFDQLLRACQSPLRAYIAGRGVRADLVDDLAQEVFLAFHREQDRMPAGVAPLAWLKGIARNLCNNHFRVDERRRQLIVSIADRLEDLPEPVPAGDDDRPERLRACLERLQPRVQALLLGYYGGDEDADRLAQRYELSPSGLRMTILRARELLRRCLGLTEA